MLVWICPHSSYTVTVLRSYTAETGTDTGDTKGWRHWSDSSNSEFIESCTRLRHRLRTITEICPRDRGTAGLWDARGPGQARRDRGWDYSESLYLPRRSWVTLLLWNKPQSPLLSGFFFHCKVSFSISSQTSVNCVHFCCARQDGGMYKRNQNKRYTKPWEFSLQIPNS